MRIRMDVSRFNLIFVSYLVVGLLCTTFAERCRFRPLNNGGVGPRVVKIAEDAPLQSEIFRFEVWPRTSLILEPVGTAEDKNLVALKSISTKWAILILNRPLKVLGTQNRTSARYRLTCYGSNSTEPDILSLVLDIEDVNDNAPEFVPPAPYHVVIEESVTTGTIVMDGIRAIDRDRIGTLNAKVEYYVRDELPKLTNVVARRVGGTNANKTTESRFSLTTQADGSATLVLKSALDYDKGERDITLHIVAKDQGIPSQSSTALVVIHVEDVDDLPPVFSRSVYRARFREHYPIQKKRNHQRVTVEPPISALDQDTGINMPVQYSIIGGDPEEYFFIDADLGTLYVEKYVDRESLSKDTFTLTIQATQVDNPAQWATAALEIEVMDLNDNLPDFGEKVYNISIMENLPNGFSVLQVLAKDLDKGENSEFTYRLQDPSHSFALDPATGWLIVSNQTQLDREKSPVLKMKVSTVEKALSILPASSLADHSAIIEVYLLDTNDNNPSFVPHNVYHFQVEESASAGAIVGQVLAEDADAGFNGEITYTLQMQDRQGQLLNDTVIPFSIHSSTGYIIVADSPLDTNGYTLLIEASDQPANPSEKRTSVAIAHVKVEPSVDQIPQFVNTPYEFWVGANAHVDASVGQVKARGLQDSQLRYSLRQPTSDQVPVVIDARSGVLRIAEDLYATTVSQYWLEVKAVDDKRSITSNVTLHIVDSASRLRSEVAPINFSIQENMGPTLLGTLTYPMDRRLSRRGMEFSISTQQSPLGTKFQVFPNGSFFNTIALDREEGDLIPISVIVQEKSSHRPVDVLQVFVHVQDMNDNPPRFLQSSYTATVNRSSAMPGALIQVSSEQIQAIDPDAAPHNVVTYELSGVGSDNFVIHSHNGQISLRRSLPSETDSFALVINAYDQGNLSSQATLDVRVLEDVNEHPPRITGFIPSNFTVQLPFNAPFSAHHSPLHMQITKQLPSSTRLGHFQANDTDKSSIDLRFYIIEGDLFDIDPEKGTLTLNSHWSLHPKDSFGPIQVEVSVLDQGGLKATPQVVVFHFKEESFTLEDTVQNSDNSVDSNSTLENVFDNNNDLRGSSNDWRLHNHSAANLAENNNSPRFLQPQYELNIPEGFYDGEVLAAITATDQDPGAAGNVSYFLLGDEGKAVKAGEIAVFRVEESTGQLRAYGMLDRELVSNYEFQVMARDQGQSPRNSSVSLVIHLVDVNDNRPVLSGYDSLTSELPISPSSHLLGEESDLYPVYSIILPAMTPPWTSLLQIPAADFDLDSNAELHYMLLNHQSVFAVEVRTGELYNTVDLRETDEDEFHVVVGVSDQGTPPLSSFAVVKIGVERSAGEAEVTTMEEVTLDARKNTEDISSSLSPAEIFGQPLYEMSLEENCIVPRLLWNLSQLVQPSKLKLKPGAWFKFELSSNASLSNVDLDENGQLWLIQSPDRENLPEFNIRVRGILQMNDSNANFDLVRNKRQEIVSGETTFKVSILDENDNAPEFLSPSPIVAAVPLGAPYGYGVIRLQAHDADQGLNAALKYELVALSSAREKFALQPNTGQVIVVGNFARDVIGSGISSFTFNVTVRDREGLSHGLSAMTEVIVHLVDETNQVALVLGVKPTEVEDALDWIMEIVRNITSEDIRVRGIEAHTEGDMAESGATDLYLYAVNHSTHALVEPDVLLGWLEAHKNVLNHQLRQYGPRHLRGGPLEKRLSSSARIQVFEVTLIAIGAAVFIGALVTIISVLMARKKKAGGKTLQQQRPPATLIPGHLDYRLRSSKTFYVSEPYTPVSGESTSDTYVEVPLHGARDSQDNLRQYYIASNGLWTVHPRCRACQAHTGTSQRRCQYCQCSLKQGSRNRGYRYASANDESDEGSEGSTGRTFWQPSEPKRRAISRSKTTTPVNVATLNQLPTLAAIRINYHPSSDKHSSITSGESYEDSLKPIRDSPARQSVLSPNTYSSTPSPANKESERKQKIFFGERT